MSFNVKNDYEDTIYFHNYNNPTRAKSHFFGYFYSLLYNPTTKTLKFNISCLVVPNLGKPTTNVDMWAPSLGGFVSNATLHA